MITKKDKQDLLDFAKRNRYKYTVIYTRAGKVHLETVRHALPLRGRNFFKIRKDLEQEVKKFRRGKLRYIIKGHPDVPQFRHLPPWFETWD